MGSYLDQDNEGLLHSLSTYDVIVVTGNLEFFFTAT